MLASEQTNSSPVKKNSPFMETVQDKLKDIKNFSNWSAKEQMIAVGAVGVMVGALLPFVAVALPVAATGAIVALTLFFAYKAVEYTFKGLKWSAEKTVDGAKYTAEKVKDASTYAAGKIRDGAVHVKDKVGEGVDSLKKRLKERDRIVFYNHAKEGDAIEKMTKFPEEDRKKAGEIKHELKAIFADKGDNSKLVKNILSEILLKIDLKIAEEAKSESREHTPKWQVQKDFIKHLSEKDLRVLIKQKALPSDVYFIDRVFSEHYDEIKEVIAKCKEDHILKGSLKMRNNMFEEGSAKLSRSFSLPSFSLLGRNNSEQSNSLPRSSSMSSVRTDSTISSKAELLDPANRKEVKQSSGFFSRFKRNETPKEATNVEYQTLSESDMQHRKIGKSTFYVDTPTESTATVSDSDSQDFATVNPNRLRRSNSSSSLTPKLTPIAPPKPPARNVSLLNLYELNASSQNSLSKELGSNPIKVDPDKGTLTRSNSFDSGRGSSNPSPVHATPIDKNGKVKTQDDLRKTGLRDKLVPSTKVAVDTDVQQQAAQTAVKTN